jgi:leucyl-tRNA---protein transferase
MDESLIFWEEPTSDATNIRDLFSSSYMPLSDWENMLAQGWRHNGMHFFKMSTDYDDQGYKLDIIPLRYRLSEFAMSKSQRKIWRKNQDLTYKLTPLSIRDEMHLMFDQHTARFKYNLPYSIFDFVSPEPNAPFPTFQFEIYYKDKLIACTFIDLTMNTLSSTYAMFDLEESKRSLGIFTMLLEMAYGVMTKKNFHYPGYAFMQPSHMDYKKEFAGSEYYDWQTANWYKL